MVEPKSQDAPAFYASGVALAVTGTDIKLVFSDQKPVIDENGTISSDSNQMHCGSVSLSFHAAKDLCVLLSDSLANLCLHGKSQHIVYATIFGIWRTEDSFFDGI